MIAPVVKELPSSRVRNHTIGTVPQEEAQMPCEEPQSMPRAACVEGSFQIWKNTYKKYATSRSKRGRNKVGRQRQRMTRHAIYHTNVDRGAKHTSRPTTINPKREGDARHIRIQSARSKETNVINACTSIDDCPRRSPSFFNMSTTPKQDELSYTR